MDTGKRLAEIWRADYMGALPVSVKERGYTYAENVRKDILITGCNPSFRPGDSAGIFSGPISNIWESQQYDTYFSPIRKMLYDGELDLRDSSRLSRHILFQGTRTTVFEEPDSLQPRRDSIHNGSTQSNHAYH